jgi:hypothetical protein
MKRAKICNLGILVFFLLFSSFSTCFADITCDIIDGYDWNEADNTTWTSGIYQLTIECQDELSNPVVGHVADFDAVVNLRTTGDTVLHTVPLKSTPTNADGQAYLTTALIHTPSNDESNYVHQCPFDDILCPTVVNSSRAVASRTTPNMSFGSSSEPILECLGFETGCCMITTTIKNCVPPIVLNSYCTNADQDTCDNIIPYSDAYIEIATVYHSELVCNSCDKVCEEETLIELSSFTATPGSKKVTLGWETASEIDNTGFNIYRAESEGGEYIRINASLFPAEGSPTQGAAYSFTDAGLKNRKTYYYKLEDIDLNGVSTMHGPVSATPRLIYGIGK